MVRFDNTSTNAFIFDRRHISNGAVAGAVVAGGGVWFDGIGAIVCKAVGPLIS
jgi:hypothetical protein